MEEQWGEIPLAQLEDKGALMRQYQYFDSNTLRRWAQAVVGPHREAMIAILRQRGDWKE
ncbi:MAG: hypothetical protein K2F83_02890 [Oscillospiraceae bacterium]|nr:hypothetical protein [Oscillospiraceae bacterium]